MSARQGPTRVGEQLPGLVEGLEAEVARAPIEALPRLVGELARLSALAHLRISQAAAAPPATQEERVLSVKEVAVLFGRDPSWVYRNLKELESCRCPFPGGGIGFSKVKIEDFLRTGY